MRVYYYNDEQAPPIGVRGIAPNGCEGAGQRRSIGAAAHGGWLGGGGGSQRFGGACAAAEWQGAWLRGAAVVEGRAGRDSGVLRRGKSGSCGDCRWYGADLRRPPRVTTGHSPRWRSATRAGSRLQEMVRVTGSLVVDGGLQSALDETSLSSAKLVPRLSVRKISNSAVLDEEGSF